MSESGAKIFVSYSRADSAFAQELVSGIEACGFDAFIDKVDIAHGEAWQSRLGDLINRADTIVWVVSPASLSSEVVAWELDTAAKASKRIVPVTYVSLDMSTVREELRRLNFCFFFNRPFGDALKDLAVALRMDVGWLREHTRVADLARRWDELGRTDDLLLRGKELDAVRQWSSSRPANAPPLTDIQAGLIAASNRAQEEADRNAKRRGRRVVLIASAVSIVMTALAGASVWLWLRAAALQEATAASFAQSAAANKMLVLKNAELTAPRRIQILGGNPVLEPNWHEIATRRIKSSIKVGMRDRTGFQPLGSSTLVQGELLHADLAGKTVLMTAAHVAIVDWVSADNQIEDLVGIVPEFSGAGAGNMISLGAPLYVSQHPTGVAIYEAPTELLVGLEPIDVIAESDFLDLIPKMERPQGAEGPGLATDVPPFIMAFSYPDGGVITISVAPIFGQSILEEGYRSILTARWATRGASGAPLVRMSDGALVGLHMMRAFERPEWNLDSSEDFEASGAAWIGDVVSDIRANYKPAAE